MALMRILTLAILMLIPLTANAQYECAGSIGQENFHDQMKKINQQIQADVISYRQMQKDLSNYPKGSEEAETLKKKIVKQKALLDEHKKTFEELNSPNFPVTNFAVLGAACKDQRWVGKAKEVLLEKRELLGKTFFVWLDKNTREVKVAEKRPPLGAVAR